MVQNVIANVKFTLIKTCVQVSARAGTSKKRKPLHWTPRGIGKKLTNRMNMDGVSVKV